MISGDYAYILNQSYNGYGGNSVASIVTYNITYPDDPVYVSTTTTGLSEPNNMTLSGNYLYVIDQENGIVII
jgi:hypothetical protein